MTLGPNEAFCRVVGLKSEKGKKRNGSAGIVRKSEAGDAARRSVCMDGFPSPTSVKLENLDMIVDAAPRTFSVGVGRNTLLDTQFNAVFVEDTGGASPRHWHPYESF